MTESEPKRFDPLTIVIPVAIFLIAAAVFLPALKFDFVTDDPRQIEMMASRFTWSQIPSYFTTDVWSYLEQAKTNYYRPIFMLWLMLNYQVIGTSHMWWHASTILAHAVAALLFYFLALKLTKARAPAAIAAVLFAVYPVHVEEVAWVSGVTEPLWAILFFTSLLLFLYGRDAEPSRARWLRAGSVAAFMLGVFAKETAFVTPLLIFAYLFLFPESADLAPAKRAREAVIPTIPYWQAGIVYIGMRIWALGSFSPVHTTWSKTAQIATIPRAAWYYLRELAWPFHLTVFPDVSAVRNLGTRDFFLPAIGLAALLALLSWIAMRSRSRITAFSILLTLLPITPLLLVRSFAPDDFVHDRYLYVPAAGWCLLIAVAIAGMPTAVLRAALVIPLAALLAYSTLRQMEPWRNDFTLADHAIAMNPASRQAIIQKATALLLSERYIEAEPLLRQALAPTFRFRPELHAALGMCELRLREWDEAARQLRIALAAEPNVPKNHLFLGMALLEMNQIPEAEHEMREALRLRPQASIQYQGYRVYLADLLERKGDYDAAFAEYNREMEEYPEETWVLDRTLALRKKMSAK